MRQVLTALALVALLVAAALPAPARYRSGSLASAQGTGPACGEDAPDGLILYHAYDSAGKALDPPLAITDPTGAVQRPVEVPEPREITPLDYGCKALIRSADGGTYLVDGATGEAVQLDLGDPADDLQRVSWAGGSRYGLFAPGGTTWEQSVMVDYETGDVLEVPHPSHSPDYIMWLGFSPSGNYLMLKGSTASGEDDGVLLVPPDDPENAQSFGDSCTWGLWFDPEEERVLYKTLGPSDTEQLIVENIATGSRQLVTTAPTPAEGESSLYGWFLHGHDDLVAVQYLDRLAIFDLSGGDPVERHSIAGVYGSVTLAPGGTTGIVSSETPPPIADGSGPVQSFDPAWWFVDFELGEAKPLLSGAGIPVQVIGPTGPAAEEWLLAVERGDFNPKTLVRVNIETGELVPILMLADESIGDAIWSTEDRSRVLLETTIEGNDQRVRLVDLKTGDVLELATAGRAGGVISPDGQWVSYSTLEAGAETRTITLVVVDTETGEETFRGHGLSPEWLGP